MNILKMASVVSNGLEQNKIYNLYLYSDLYAENEDDNADVQDEYEVIEIAPNRYKTTFHVPQ